MAAIRKCRLEIGESALVMGVGLLGMMAIKILKASGACPLIAIDPDENKRKIAEKIGADYVFDPNEFGFAEKVKAVTCGGANVAIEVTGNGKALDSLLDCMAKLGRVALLGCTRISDFTIDYYTKVHFPGISLIGAHTHARAELESSHGNYTHIDDIKAVLRLCANNRLTLCDVVKETHCPSECEKVYERLINDKNFPVGVQFDWKGEW
jgi:threonine dehydrogenase-like Zn-dependent dehydrogenase